MSKLYKRRIRVEGKPHEIVGWMLTVKDADTGEDISNVRRIEMALEPTEMNVASVTYHEVDEQGKFVLDNGKPVETTELTHNPDVAVTAFEKMSPLEEMVHGALADVYMGRNHASASEVGERLIAAIKQWAITGEAIPIKD